MFPGTKNSWSTLWGLRGFFSSLACLSFAIIFFPFDYEKYTSKDRELYFDYNEFTPGPKAYNLQELFSVIDQVAKGNDQFKEQRAKIRNLTYTYKDGNASQRVFDFLESISGK